MTTTRNEDRRKKAVEAEAKKTTLRQEHRLMDGQSVSITRTGNHIYRVNDGTPMQSVTALAKYLDGDGFGAGMGWATKIIRESGGDSTAPRRISDQSMQIGNDLHEAIQGFIDNGTISESEMFVTWFHAIGKKPGRTWIKSEQLIYHPQYKYGGTADALSEESDGQIAIWDWKTKDSYSFEKYGSYPKEHAQLSAYAKAYQAMGSRFRPTTGYLCYVMRDKPETRIVRVDLEKGWELFKVSYETHSLVRRFNDDE